MKWVALTFVACSAPVTPDPVQPAPAPLLTMSDAAFGPLQPTSPATLVALRAAFAGYDVRPVHHDGLEYQVFDRDQRLFTVVPAGDGTIFNVDVASPEVAVAGRGWKVGAKLVDWRALSACACWGGKPVCYRVGDHVALGFDRGCRGLTRSLRGLEGLSITRAIWKPRPFGSPMRAMGGAEYGGSPETD
ncbi:MAG: hypothetical protein WKG01_39635 [Kofleriaceae bacterium]